MKLIICLLLITLTSYLSGQDLVTTKFAEPSVVPSPACLCASADGKVFVGVDLNGSLGKGPDKGRIIRLVDTNGDGVADSHTKFAKVDNPRGLFAVGNKLFVLHTVYPAGKQEMSGMHLSVFTDQDDDGIADDNGKRLVKNISTLKHNLSRGADHTTNGIRMGIDGWIYIAVGDFGFVDAEGTDGTKLTLLGGGVLRVRPDGTEMEMYTKGLRNIYDVAIDPFMNVYTRGNTNDGGGWNVRFIHHIQSGNYGYPMLFKRFTGDILPALADVGGGSGTGAVYFQEPSWPEKYNNVPLMADWGRSHLYIHRVTPDGASFTQQQEDYIKCSQISDVDVDAHGQLFVSAWDGAGYKGNPSKGYVQRIVPTDWQRQQFTKPSELSTDGLIKGLRSASATARLHYSQELVNRGEGTVRLLDLAAEKSASLESRVAAIFTYAQLAKQTGAEKLSQLAQNHADIREWALRAAADRKPWAKSASLTTFKSAIKDSNPRVQVAAAVGLGRIGNSDAAEALLSVANPPTVDDNKHTTAHWTSEEVTGDKQIEIDVEISAYKQITLIADPINDNGQDHIAWVNPRIINTDGTVNDLTKLKFKASQGWGKTLVNKDCTGSPLLDVNKKPHVGIGSHALSTITFQIPNKRTASRFKATGILTSKSNGKGSVKFIVSPTPKIAGKEGPHATPNAAIILPHVAVNALRECNSIDPCLSAISGPQASGALWALNQLHSSATVDGLITQYNKTTDPFLNNQIIITLARLYHREADYDGSWWWSTRPDTRGPYYVPATWEGSEKIETFLREIHSKADALGKQFIAETATFHRLNLKGLGKVEVVSKAQSKKGELGRTSIEDVILSLDKLKGDRKRGKKVLAKMACAACHNIEKGQPIKGPDLAALGKQTLADIAESIIKPEATIAKSWVNITKNDNSVVAGTIASKTNTEVLVHNIAGIPTKIPVADIKSTQPGPPLMGPHLADDLSLQEFADLVVYLQKMGD